MTAIHAPSRHYDRILETGIRPFDIAVDLRPVAELIANAFASELDERGNSALREMRLMSHFGGILGVVNRNTGEFDDMLNGFVWVEAGQVVGNITVQRAEKSGRRWQIANVAVALDHRGRGISRRLMETALDHATECGGQWAVLQVYARNQIARHLYASMGFEEVGGTVDLWAPDAPRVTLPDASSHLQSFSAADWQPLYELANHQLGAQAQWWRALRRTDFQQTVEEQFGEWLARLAGQRHVYRRAIQVSPRFEAAAILSARRWRGEHRIQLWVRPEHYGSHDATLIQWALATLQAYPRWPVVVSVNTGHVAALDILQTYHFEPRRTLLTLRKRIGTGSDEP